ncbi:MAG: TMEM175 family protein [Anaerolineales bacterium]
MNDKKDNRSMNTDKKSIILSGASGNERITAFSDGVFAIAITLLVFRLSVPATLPENGLWDYVPKLLPLIASNVLGFIVLGIYWVGHHNMFKHIKRHDRSLMWLNILFLMCVAMMPFFAGLISEHGEDTIALAFYAFWLMLTGLVLDSIWWYASKDHRLVDSNIDPDLILFVHRRVLTAPLLYLISIGVVFISHTLTWLIFVTVILIYILPTPLDQIHHKQLNIQEDID